MFVVLPTLAHLPCLRCGARHRCLPCRHRPPPTTGTTARTPTEESSCSYSPSSLISSWVDSRPTHHEDSGRISGEDSQQANIIHFCTNSSTCVHTLRHPPLVWTLYDILHWCAHFMTSSTSVHTLRHPPLVCTLYDLLH